MTKNAKRKLGYLSGPIDARQVYDSWRRQIPLGYFGTSYLSQFFAVAEALDYALVVTTSLDGDAYDAHRPGVEILNRPRRTGLSGLSYHLHELAWVHARMREMVRLGAQTVVLTDSMLYWWALLPWRLRGIKFINALHCAVLRPDAHEPLVRRTLVKLMALCHYRFNDPTLAASPLIVSQLQMLGCKAPCKPFLPTYAPDQFAGISPPTVGVKSEYHILFAGRVERNKGVFDLLEVCRRLAERGGPRLVFDVCGEGGASDELAAAVQRAGMNDLFRVHGFCHRDALIGQFEQSDIVVVPTRSDFEEGFAMIVAEGVIARRPVVTSRVCPGLAVVREAAVEVEPDDIDSYAEAIWSLVTDRQLYRQKCDAAEQLRGKFFQAEHSYGTKLREALADLTEETSLRRSGRQ